MSIGCRDLRVTTGRRVLLELDALDVASGQTLAVLGPNGAGKSTLLRSLAHLGRLPWTGQILLDGVPAGRAEIRGAVAAVLQRPVLQRASVLDNAAAGLTLRGVPRRVARERARPWLDALGVGPLAQQDGRTLSGGEAQRVAIARALTVEPRVLLLDEPFAGMDATTRADLIADLRTALDQLGAAVALVTHDRDEAQALAARTALIVGGRLRQLGPTAEVLDGPADADCAALLGYTTQFPPALTGLDSLLVARPERCHLVPVDATVPPGSVAVPGTVRRVVPLGGMTRVDIDTAAEPAAVLTTADITARPGAAVLVAVDLRHARRCPPLVGAAPASGPGHRPAGAPGHAHDDEAPARDGGASVRPCRDT